MKNITHWILLFATFFITLQISLTFGPQVGISDTGIGGVVVAICILNAIVVVSVYLILEKLDKIKKG